MVRGKTANAGAESGSDSGTGEPVHITDNGGIENLDGQSDIPTIDPTTLRGNPDIADAPRKRGRPRGSRTNHGGSQSGKTEKQKASDLSSLLFSLHSMGAVILKAEELELTKDEAKRLSDAIAEVNDEFGGIVISPKAAAIANLCMTAGAIYGPRAVSYNMRVRKEQAAKTIEAEQPVRVTPPMNPQPQAAGATAWRQ